MKGSIRFAVGFILVLGGVGGIENSVDILPSLYYAIAGLGLMAWATVDFNKAEV